MVRVHKVEKARKAQKEHGIKKGDSYYWWKFAFGAKRVSKTYPRRGQLTQSDFLSQWYDLEDSLSAIDCTDEDGASDEVRSIAGDVENLRSEQEEKRDNLEQAFPNGCPALETITARIEACERVESELEDAANTIDCIEAEEDEDPEEFSKRLEREIRDAIDGVDWSSE